MCLGCDVGDCTLVEVLSVVLFSEKGEQQVMALRDSGFNTTFMDEELAQSLGLKGKEMELQIQGVKCREGVYLATHKELPNC